jgi:hypothetical protein
MSQRSLKTLSVLASLALVVGVMVGGADVAGAKKKKKKKKPKSVACETYVPTTAGSEEVEVLKVDDTFTEEAPLVIEFTHPASGPIGQTPVGQIRDQKFFNIQSYSKAAEAGMYARMEFANHSDLDLYFHNAGGDPVASSGAFNQAPVDASPAADFSDGGNGGMGFESISGFRTAQCTGYTVRSSAYLTPGTDVTLTIWLGEVVPAE